MNLSQITSGNNQIYRTQRGVSLIELMVAMAIGLVLVYGASAVYLKSRATYSDNDAIARLQESARYALNAIEQDVRLSSYWGLYPTQKNGSTAIDFQADQVTPAPSAPTVASVASGGPVNACGKNFAVDLKENIQGDNNGFLPNKQTGIAGFLSLTNTNSCQPYNNRRVTTADTLTIRRADTNTALTGTLRICSAIAGSTTLVNNSASCLNDGITTLINQLLVHAYYVDQDSLQQVGLPSLRRMTLIAGPAFDDEEVIAGVEDMQVQFGIETTADFVQIPLTGVASHYVNPDSDELNPKGKFPLNPNAAVQVVAVRVWLLMRGETPETNFTDNKIYEYGDRLQANGITGDLNNAADATKAYQPSASTDPTLQRYRRLVVSRTFQIRNSTLAGT